MQTKDTPIITIQLKDFEYYKVMDVIVHGEFDGFNQLSDVRKEELIKVFEELIRSIKEHGYPYYCDSTVYYGG